MRPAETSTRLRAEDVPQLANDCDLRRELDEGRLIEMSPVNYLQAGASTVWLVDPEVRQVQVLEARGPDRRLAAGDILTAPELLPGWSLLSEKLFA